MQFNVHLKMYSYTLYCILLFCCNQVLCLEVPDELFDKEILKCASDLNVDKMILINNLDKDFHLPKGNEKLTQYSECILRSHGALLEDGTLDHGVMVKDVANILLPFMEKKGNLNEMAVKVTDECIIMTGVDLHDRLTNLHNCLVDAANKY